MALADVLQWADATRVRGTLTVQRDSGRVWMRLSDRSVVTASKPVSRPVTAALAPHSTVALPEATLAIEQLYDQFLDPDGTFSLSTGEEKTDGEEGVAVELLIAELLMEGVRLLDEWPRINETYPSESARLGPLDAPAAALSAVQEAVLECAKERQSLESTRLALGLSRPALLRNVDALRGLGLLVVDGAPEGADLIAKLVNQAKLLLKEQQFDEAAHVFRNLLTADPSARAVKQLLKEAEAEQRRVLSEKLPAHLMVERVTTKPAVNLSFVEREVLERVNDRWDIGVIMLASPMRESETLKVIDRLLRRGVLRVREPG